MTYERCIVDKRSEFAKQRWFSSQANIAQQNTPCHLCSSVCFIRLIPFLFTLVHWRSAGSTSPAGRNNNPTATADTSSQCLYAKRLSLPPFFFPCFDFSAQQSSLDHCPTAALLYFPFPLLNPSWATDGHKGPMSSFRAAALFHALSLLPLPSVPSATGHRPTTVITCQPAHRRHHLLPSPLLLDQMKG